jgi:hypothetical protein
MAYDALLLGARLSSVMAALLVLTLWVDRSSGLGLLRGWWGRLAYGAALAALLLLSAWNLWLLVISSVGLVVVFGSLIAGGLGRVDFLKWSKGRRRAVGACFLLILVYVLPSFPIIPLLEWLLFIFWILSMGKCCSYPH